MYADPSLIRKHRTPVNLCDPEQEMLDAICKFTGQQPAVVIRQLALEQARLILAGEAQYPASGQRNEAPLTALQSA